MFGPVRFFIAFTGVHIFGRTCAENGITHKLIEPYHRPKDEPNNQAATLKVSHYPDLDSRKAHVLAFIRAYNFAKHLKALRWKTLFEAISQPGQLTLQSSESTHVTSFRDQTPAIQAFRLRLQERAFCCSSKRFRAAASAA